MLKNTPFGVFFKIWIGSILDEGNTIQFPNYWRGMKDLQNVPTESYYYLPLNRNTNTPCHYKITGKIHQVSYPGNEFDFKLNILLPEKPTTNRTYNITSSSYAGISVVAQGKHR